MAAVKPKTAAMALSPPAWARFLARHAGRVGNGLVPPHCVLCKRPATQSARQSPASIPSQPPAPRPPPTLCLCAPCEFTLRPNAHSCAVCARPLPLAETAAAHDGGVGDAPQTDGGRVCGQCQKTSPRYDRVVAPYTYSEPARALVIDLKFHEKLLNARVLAILFAKRLNARPPHDSWPDTLIPVPLHPSRIRRRGYNQSLELARELGRLTAIPVRPRHCERRINTAPQADLPLAQKRANVRGAFACRADLKGRHIAIVDDVMTSGHTVGEMARALKKSRAARVDVWVMTRAGKGTD